MIINPILKKTVVNSVEPESVTVDLDMKNGDQVITPNAGKLLDKVTVKKPSTFQPENIKNGVTIAGVVGSYETPAETLAATANGEYTPPAGKHFSKVTVNVEATSDGTSEDLTAELTEQDELLTEIEAALGLKTISATLTVKFAYEREEEDEFWGSFPSAPATGSYTIDDGGAVYFENAASLSIEASVGSVIKISIDNEWRDPYSTREAIGCEGDYLCENKECGVHGYGGCAEGVIITIADETASVMVYSVYY